MIKNLALNLTPEIAYEPERLKFKVATELDIDPQRVLRVDIIRRSIDARKRQVMVNLSVVAHINAIDMTAVEPEPIRYQDVSNAKQAVIVGAGPAGLFAALQLIELGIKPIIVERGKDVDSRRKDLALINRENIVDPDSNYCFGEGGAGAYSDGKLYTRSKKRGPVDKVLQVFYQHGAQRDILVDAHPHIGTDRLPEVIKAMRNTIINSGGEVHFQTKATGLLTDSEGKVNGIVTSTGATFNGPVILATGHSARDIYHLLNDSGITIEPKGIAVGVRLEHPQKLIDSIQYHNPQGRGKYLPAAEYTMLTRVDDRAVYSFCMCPGGFIIPAASEPGQLVVNGMSPSNRGTKWANSGMVVEILPEDLPDYDKYGALKMMYFQSDVETKFSKAVNGTQQAPAQRMTDFVNSRPSKSLPESSYAPGLIPARMDQLLPPFIAKRLQRGFADFGRKARGFLTNEAVLIGDETRTSSPVRIPRDKETLAHITTLGLYPCGEGAGYAGGIVSAAIDGIRCAEALAATL
jgi:uncharacterized FAD-dependent dehydrogenase